MSVILTPYLDANGVQKLKVASQPRPKYARGLTPPAFEPKSHLARCLYQLRTKDKDIEKNIYLNQLKDADPDIFYKLCLEHLTECAPLLYTPTVGDACLLYSENYRRPDGMFISLKDKGKIGEIISNWPHLHEARISVVTDGSRILGLGDLGVNGMPIPLGKLILYTLGAGIRPTSTLPITLDLGTDTQKFLEDPFYLGMREHRPTESVMTAFMDEFMEEITKLCPKLLVQFEDFNTPSAFRYLERYRDKYPVFNDDIQGTGAVVLSGFINAAKLSSAASGRPLTDHRILFFGAGSAGVGVAKQLTTFFKLHGLSEEKARESVYLVDTHGLIYDTREDGVMADHKRYFSRKDYSGPPIKNLVDIIDLVKPTALMGLSTTKDAFTKEIVEKMAAINPRPIIFPLSNPVKLSECEFHDAVEWTKGTVLFASGSPFPNMEYGGKMLHPGQGNNMYIFPGLGLGSILAQARTVTDTMVEASSIALAESLIPEEKAKDYLYPDVERIREVSAQVVHHVIRAAQAAGVDRAPGLKNLSDKELAIYIQQKTWTP